MKTNFRTLLQALLTVTYTALLATGCGGGGGGGGAGPGPDDPVAEEEQAVVGQALVGAVSYPDAAAEAKIATIGSVLAVNPTGHVYQVQLNDGVSVADAQGILGGDILYVEKNYLAHPFAAAADPDWNANPGPQYGTAVKAELAAAWTAAAAVPVPVARVTIDGVAPAADTKTVTIAGEVFTGGDGTGGTVDITSDATQAATNLAAAINADATLTAAGISAAALGDSTVVLTLAPGSSAVTLSADPAFTLSATSMTAPTKVITIAVIDSGVNCAHEDLAAKCAAGRDFTGGVAAGTALLANASSDDVGHGTQVAGVAAAETGNGLGIAGVAGLGQSTIDPAVVKVVPVKVSSATIAPNHALIARGIDWAVNTLNPPADIILVSMGSSSSSFTLQKSIENAWKKGALVVAAAGNEGVKVMRYPAAYQFTGTNGQNVLSVTHVNAVDALVAGSTGSNSGTWVNLAAPGTGVIAPTFDPTNAGLKNIYTDASGAYPKLAGSSYAAAFVAGAAALVKAAHPTLKNDELRNILASSVETFDHASGQTLAKTGGRFNVQQAMALAATPTAKEVAGLVLSQSSISGGLKATGTVVLLNGNSSGVTTVALASDDSSVTVPATLSVPAGATSATFNVITTALAAPKTVHITAGVTQGKEVTATLAVGVAALSKVACTPATLVVGQTSTCTITLDVAAPAAGIDVGVVSSDATIASVSAATVNIKSATTATFTLLAKKAGKIHATAQIGSGPTVDTNDVTVSGATLAVSFTSATVAGGGTLSGKLAWNGKLPADTVVHFATTDATNVPAPSDLTVKAGATSATFSTKVGTPDASVTANLTVTIPADTSNTAITQAGTGKDGAVTVQGIAVKSIDLTTTTITAGGPLTGTVTLNNAPANGAVDVALSLSSDLCYLDVAKVTVAKSATKSGNFTVTCPEPSAKTALTLTAQAPSTTAKTATLSLLPTLASVALYTQGQTPALATSYKAGDVLDVVVTLNAAPAAGTVVDVAVADATGSKASLPTLGASTVTVLATKTTGKVTLTGAGSVGGKVVITATYGPVSVTSTVSYTAPALSGLAVSTATILEGGATTLTVTTEAASGATDVALTYSPTSALSSPPAKVTVADTTTSKTATLTAVSSGLTASKAVVVTGTLNGVKKTTTVTVLPATFNSVGTAGAATITKSTTVQVPVVLSAAQAITCSVDATSLVSGLTAPATVAFTTAASVNLALVADGTVSAGSGGSLDVTCGGVTKTLTVTIQ